MGWGAVCLLVLGTIQEVGPATPHLGKTKLPSLMKRGSGGGRQGAADRDVGQDPQDPAAAGEEAQVPGMQAGSPECQAC